MKCEGSAGVPQSPALRSSRNCCCAKVVVSFILCVSALMLTVTKIAFFLFAFCSFYIFASGVYV